MSATNVQFSVAVHMMAALGDFYGEEVRSEKLASSVKANPSFIRRTLSRLAKAGLVQTARGRNGACRLGRPAEEITLLDIYRASAAPAPFSIHNYPIEERCCTSAHIKSCLTGILGDIQEAFEQSLAKTTLAQVVTEIRERSA
jgi:Rrf2 family protein